MQNDPNMSMDVGFGTSPMRPVIVQHSSALSNMFISEPNSRYYTQTEIQITVEHSSHANAKRNRAALALSLHGTARYGSVRFTFRGFSTGYCTWYYFSTTSTGVPSDPYRYQNVTWLCWSLIGRDVTLLITDWPWRDSADHWLAVTCKLCWSLIGRDVTLLITDWPWRDSADHWLAVRWLCWSLIGREVTLLITDWPWRVNSADHWLAVTWLPITDWPWRDSTDHWLAVTWLCWSLIGRDVTLLITDWPWRDSADHWLAVTWLCWSLIGRRTSSLLRHWTCDTRPNIDPLDLNQHRQWRSGHGFCINPNMSVSWSVEETFLSLIDEERIQRELMYILCALCIFLSMFSVYIFTFVSVFYFKNNLME